jgi:hypothetical protein
MAKAEWLELRGERFIAGRMREVASPRLASLLGLESWGFVTPVLTGRNVVLRATSFDRVNGAKTLLSCPNDGWLEVTIKSWTPQL